MVTSCISKNSIFSSYSLFLQDLWVWCYPGWFMSRFFHKEKALFNLNTFSSWQRWYSEYIWDGTWFSWLYLFDFLRDFLYRSSIHQTLSFYFQWIIAHPCSVICSWEMHSVICKGWFCCFLYSCGIIPLGNYLNEQPSFR